MSQGKNWCFTINANEEIAEDFQWKLATADDHPLMAWPTEFPDIAYLVYQVEAGSHVHLQGCVSFCKKKRLTQVHAV